MVIKAEPGWPAPAQLEPGAEPWGPATKGITSVDNLEVFLKSEAMAGYMSFVLALNKAALGRQIPQTNEASQGGRGGTNRGQGWEQGKAWGLPLCCAARCCSEAPPWHPWNVQGCSESVGRLMDLLEALESLVDTHPPVTRSLRYGNPAFRQDGLLGFGDTCSLLAVHTCSSRHAELDGLDAVSAAVARAPVAAALTAALVCRGVLQSDSALPPHLACTVQGLDEGSGCAGR